TATAVNAGERRMPRYASRRSCASESSQPLRFMWSISSQFDGHGLDCIEGGASAHLALDGRACYRRRLVESGGSRLMPYPSAFFDGVRRILTMTAEKDQRPMRWLFGLLGSGARGVDPIEARHDFGRFSDTALRSGPLRADDV